MAYFERTGTKTYRATEEVGGAWDVANQHIAPALGLLLHAVEGHRDARRDDGLATGRLSYDILGTLPLGPVDIEVEVLRAGRTIELVGATLSSGGRPAVLLRAWLMQETDTRAIEGSALAPIPGPEDMAAWDPTTVWPGGFVASVQLRRSETEPGRAAFWVRTPVPLVADEPVSALAGAVGLLDLANGMAVRADPLQVAFPNIDLTAHFFGRLAGPWVGFDTTVSFGRSGLGVTSTVLHGPLGPVGTMSQALTVRPLSGG